MLGVIWWMYSGYVWLTNAVRTDQAQRRAFLLAGMGAYLILALAIPKAFSDGGPRSGSRTRSSSGPHRAVHAHGERDTFKAVLGLAPFNLATAALVLAGGIAGGTAQYVLWSAGVRVRVDHAVGDARRLHGLRRPLRRAPRARDPDRHRRVGRRRRRRRRGRAPLDLRLAAIALLGLALSATLWWSYFGDDGEAERAMEDAKPEDQQNLAVVAFGDWHLLMLLGIIGIAAAEKTVIAHPFDGLEARDAIVLGVATAVYMLGDVLFRRTLELGPTAMRATTIGLALATIPLGLALAAGQLAALTVVIAAALSSERQLT